MSVQGWALLTVIVSALVGGAIKGIGWYVERITVRSELRAKAEREARELQQASLPVMQEMYMKQMQTLLDDFRKQLEGKDAEIARLKIERDQARQSPSLHRRRSDGQEGPG